MISSKKVIFLFVTGQFTFGEQLLEGMIESKDKGTRKKKKK